MQKKLLLICFVLIYLFCNTSIIAKEYKYKFQKTPDLKQKFNDNLTASIKIKNLYAVKHFNPSKFKSSLTEACSLINNIKSLKVKKLSLYKPVNVKRWSQSDKSLYYINTLKNKNLLPSYHVKQFKNKDI